MRDWPAYGPDRPGPHLSGHTNAVPDVVGPVDGSAALVVFTEGNHYPVFLPLLLEGFPRWCAETGACEVEAGEILVVTLPQVMVVEALSAGGVRFGNAVIPLGPDAPNRPDIVLGGERPLKRLAARGHVRPTARRLARHRGLGLLVRADDDIADLDGFAASVERLAIATPYEAGARRQYVATLDALIGPERRSELMARDVGTTGDRGFDARLRIQHRDVPRMVLDGRADGGIIFGHLARFYADRYPDALRTIAVPEAAPFGQEILFANTAVRPKPLARAFETFLFEAAPAAYRAGGFASIGDFDYGETLDLEP